MQEKLSPNSVSVEVKAVDYLGRRYTSHYTKMEGVGGKTRWSTRLASLEMKAGRAPLVLGSIQGLVSCVIA